MALPGNTGGGGGKPTGNSNHEIFVVLLADIVGVAVLAIVADMNEQLGKIALALMVGWLLVFAWSNAPLLQNVIGKVNG